MVTRRLGGWRVRLRITIAVTILFITVALATSLVVLNYLTSARAVHDFTAALLEPIAAAVAERAQGFLDVCGGSAAIAADLANGPGAARLDAFDEIGFALLEERPELFYVQLGDRDGNFQLVTRSPRGGIDSKRIRRDGAAVTSTWSYRDPGAPRERIRERRTDPADDYDPRKRPWYEGARGSSGVHWTDVYAHAEGGQPVITAARAVRSADGEIVGVASATLSLHGVAAFLDTIRLRDRPARVFLVDARGAVVAASSSLDLQGPAPEGTPILPLLSTSAVPELAALAATPAFRRALGGAGGPEALAYEVRGRRWLSVLRPLQGGRGWVVGAVVPEDDFLGEIKAGFARSAGLSALIIAVFVMAGLAFAGSIAGPLRRIAEETRRIHGLEFDERPLPDTVYEEIAEINQVFAHLKTGLRAFEKYVPVKLVRMLLAEGTEPRLGGRVEELTLFFSDIRGFSAHAEGTDPMVLAAELGRYLQTMAETVDAHGGTVDKFIGDAVMAFWNAPRAVDDHAYRAVLAAVRCREAARGQGEAFHTRIGLHTARVVVGNFGAPGRLSYTVLGDGVNLAARLEGVNKEYGTEILVTGETHRRLEGRLACRRIDRIAVKGRSLPTEIHEVLGEHGTVPEEALEAARIYERALEAYFARDFVEAARGFREAEARRPGDTAAAVMGARAERYRVEPPPPEWGGVFALQAK
jgi:adenylate cyclase